VLYNPTGLQARRERNYTVFCRASPSGERQQSIKATDSDIKNKSNSKKTKIVGGVGTDVIRSLLTRRQNATSQLTTQQALVETHSQTQRQQKEKQNKNQVNMEGKTTGSSGVDEPRTG
jgi:hypothetical protein